MSFALFPFIEHGSQRVQQAPSVIAFQNRQTHFRQQPVTREAGIQILPRLSTHVANLNRLDRIEHRSESSVHTAGTRRRGCLTLRERPRRYVEPAIAEELPRGMIEGPGANLEASVTSGRSYR